MAMGDPEKVAALKKVYAEIILNTAKESAARILVAERRTAGAQRELAAAKDEAIATLIRLKSIMETKIKEAKSTSMGQARKIQELEIQITEANDTITSLRMELEKVNCELEQLKHRLPENSCEKNIYATIRKDKSCENEHSSNDIACSPVRLFPELRSGHVTLRKKPCLNCFSSKELSLENESASNPDLVSLIIRGKESELYRNGCTQRIRAFERKPLSKKFSLGKNNERFSDFQKEIAYVEGSKKSSCMTECSKRTTPGIYKEVHLESNPLFQLANICGDGQDSSSTIISSRRKVGRYKSRKNKKSTSHDSSNIYGQTQATSNSSALASRAVHHVSLEDELVRTMQTKKRTRTCRRQMLPQVHTGTMLSGSDGADCRASLINSGKGEKFLPPADVREDTSTLLLKDSEICEPDPESAESLQVPAGEVKPERADVSLTKSDVKDEKSNQPCESPAQPSIGKFLKYTFERKRKRGSSNSHSGVVPYNTSTKGTADEENSEIQKPIQLMETSRDTRQMAQVARQLISLSESRW